MQLYSVHLFVCLSVPSISSGSSMQLVCCSLGMGSRCRLIAAGAAYLLSIDIVARSGQRLVEIRGTRLNTNMLVFCIVHRVSFCEEC